MEKLEKSIEQALGRKLSSWAAEHGHNIAYVKFEGARGWPDRIVTWGAPDGMPMMVWVELKRPGEKPRPMQLHVHKQLRAMGHIVLVMDNVEEAMAEITAMVRAYYG